MTGIIVDTFSDGLTAQEIATKRDLAEFSKELRSEMREMELRMTVRLGGMTMALGGILIAVKYVG